jgi:solute carrier family 13 (sodium-dependent dicarboxylate transporter), member 2/3/5
LSRWQRLGVIAGPLLLAASLLVDPPAPITPIGGLRLGLLAFAVTWWVTAPVPLAVTTLATLALGVGLGAFTLADAFATGSSWVMWFAIGAFGMGAALESTGFNRRFALGFIGHPWVRGRPRRFLLMFLLSATVMSGVMANTVVAVVWLSLAMTVYRVLGITREHPLAETNTLGIAWAANIGGVTTPVGTATNPVAIGMIAASTGVTISFLQWTLVGSVLAAVFLASVVVIFRVVLPKQGHAAALSDTVAFIDAERERLGPMPPAERRALAWFSVAIGLWVLPDITRLVAPGQLADAMSRNLSLVVPALLVPTAMCLTRSGASDGRTVLSWEQWARGVDWGMVVFIGGVMAIGAAVGDSATGVPLWLETALTPWLGDLPEYGFVFAMAFALICVTSVISNLVSLALFLPLGLTLSQSLGIGDPTAVGFVLGVAPSLAYLLPSGTTTNAIVAGSGYLRVGTMVRYGAIVVVLHAALLTGIGYPLAKWVFR